MKKIDVKKLLLEKLNKMNFFKKCYSVERLISFMFYILYFSLFISVESSIAEGIEKKAWKLYEEGKKIYESSVDKKESDMFKAEKIFMKARQIVPNDNERLSWSEIESKIIPGKGRWPEFEDVRVNYIKQYHPNRYIKKIRGHFPPSPYFLMVINPSKGEGFLKISNIGKTRMENVKVLEQNFAVGTKELMSIDEILPGKSMKNKFIFPEKIIKTGSTIKISEKYNYNPCKINFLFMKIEKFQALNPILAVGFYQNN
ncbi:uncharacterized protein Dvar_71280 [Desulfosarcina variabilis str. Montpellier]|uniref:hypothetical protein n=1 Tax=Desulfosarcina variabilis TaxID=2300 RepID=UPI003AFA35AD